MENLISIRMTKVRNFSLNLNVGSISRLENIKNCNIMKVKIKRGSEMLDATIETVDGVMVVSPKEVKFKPNDGDVVFSGSSLISIFKEMTSDTSLSAYTALSNGEFNKEFDFWSASNIRPATEEEKKKLFDKLAEEGWEWKAETKELVKLMWKPKEGERYYFPFYSNCFFHSYYADVIKTDFQKALYQKCWMFKTDRECIEFCNRLNDAINQVKP